MMAQIIEWSQGNGGAISFLTKMMNHKPAVSSLIICLKLEEAKSIRGTNLWVLYNDLCNQDMELVCKLCKLCPTAVLEDACNRQDYSGRNLVREYINR